MTEFHKDVDNKISTILARAYPEFAESDYPLFIEFMKSYYEWMETTGNPYEIISQLNEYRDVDRTTGEFLQYFKKAYIDNIPDDITADKRNLIKKIKEFYQAKGSEKSYQLLFRILFDKLVTITYPSDDILRCSDGKWLEEQVIRTTSTDATLVLSALNSRTIVGTTSGATAIIENSIRFLIGSTNVSEFTVTSIVGTFLENEEITITTAAGTVVTETIYPIYTNITLTDGGGAYIIGDDIFIRDGDDTALPIIGFADVTKVDANGTILFTAITDFGFEINNPILDFSSGGDTAYGVATGTLVTGAVGTKPGRWINTDGQLSSDKKLQDNFFYQDFSYVLKSSVPVDRWRDIVKTVIHPTGMLVFGELFSEETSITNIDMNTSFSVVSSWIIGWLAEITATLDVDTMREILVVLDPTPTYHTTFDEVRIEQRLNFEIQDYENVEIQTVIDTTIDVPVEDEYVLSARPSAWRERVWASELLLGTLNTNGDFVPD